MFVCGTPGGFSALAGGPLENAGLSNPRTWKTKTGASFTAVVADIQKDNAVFKQEDGQNERSLPLGNLIREDEAILRVVYFGQQDETQFQTTHSLVERIASNSDECADVLKQSHLDYPDSPYAGLWASVCLCAGSNKDIEAASMLRQVMTRIERQREFDRSRHSMTLASVLNNLAICMIKSHKADAAAGLLVQSLGSAPMHSPIVAQNARQLLEIGKNNDSAIELTKSSQQRLEQSLSTTPPSATGLPVGWLYSLDVDLPKFVAEAEPITGLNAPAPGLYPSLMATGLAISHDKVVASSSALGVAEKAKMPSLVTVVYDVGTELQTVKSQILKIDDASGLVAIQVPTATFSAVTPASSPTVSDNDIAVFSFVIRDNRVAANSLHSTLGKLEGQVSNSFQRLSLPEPRNGPVVDRRAQVLGIAHYDETAKEVRVTKPSLLADFSREFLDTDSTSTDSVGFERLRAACVLIVKWEGPNTSEPLFLSQDRSLTGGVASLCVRDTWCVVCKGLGFIPCGNCVKGVVSARSRVQIGVNTLTGEPIYGAKSFGQRCPSCGGRGGFVCRHCNNGRLP